MFGKFRYKFDVIFVFLILIFLSTHLLFLFNSPYIYKREECYIGTIATELINGPKFSFSQYQLEIHYPGSLFSGIITVPFFLLFGESGVSLKLVGLFMSLLTLIVVYLFLDKFFNRKAAVFFALLFIFSMPSYTIHHIISLGDHQFPLLFDAIIMFIFYNIFFDNKKDIKHFLLLGFMCGFVAWFSFQSLVMIFTCLLFWFIFDKKFFLKKYFLIFFIGLLLGYSPGIYYNLTNNFQGIFNPKMEQGLGSIDLNSNLIMKAGGRFLYITSQHIPHSFGFIDFYFLNGKFISYLYYFIFLFAFFVLFWRCRKSIFKLITGIIPLKRKNISPNKIKKEVFILAYLIIFLLIYSFSNFEIENKPYYMLALYPFILIILSLFIAKLWNKKLLRLLSSIIIIILLLIGLTGNIGLISFNNLSKGGKIYEPTCYYLLAMEIEEKINNINDAKLICNKFDLEYQQYCYIYFSSRLCGECRYNPTCVIDKCNEFDQDDRVYCYEGIGYCLYDKYKNNLTKGLDVCNLFDENYKHYCYKGFCEKISSKLGREPQEGIKRCNEMNQECRNYCYDGLALHMDEASREGYPFFPTEDTEKCTQLERQLIISRNKTICFLNLINQGLI